MNFLELYNETQKQKRIFKEAIYKNMGHEWNICLHDYYNVPVFSIWKDNNNMSVDLTVVNNKIFVKINVGVNKENEMKIKEILKACLDEVGVKK